MSAQNISDNLERSYQTFINREQPLSFFKGLAGYLGYVFSVPELKLAFDRQMDERRALYKQIEESEREIRNELDLAKKKLLALIKEKGVDVASFERYQTHSFNEKTTILQELEAYENPGSGGLRFAGHTFLSNGVAGYLFDLAANLLKAGYANELKEFLASSEEYAAYHDRANGPSRYTFTGNQYGNFIFSKTWPLRCEQAMNFDKDRALKSWGSFEKLLQFKIAYELPPMGLAAGIAFVSKGGTESVPWFGTTQEEMDIIGMAYELQRLAKSETDFRSGAAVRPGDLRNLKQISLKEAAQTAHDILMRAVVESELPQAQKNTLKSIHLVTSSITANDAIFLVIDGRFEAPIRFEARNSAGKDTAMKKLHNLAYVVDAPGKRVAYDKAVADNINNGLFKNRRVADYMKTNKLDKPTLVQKSQSGDLVLKNETPIHQLTFGALPQQHRHLYVAKTR